MTWPIAIVVAVIIVMGTTAAMIPSMTRASVRVEEAKAKGAEHYRALSDEYTKLAEETRQTQAAMQRDLAAIRATVESIETMMREVG